MRESWPSALPCYWRACLQCWLPNDDPWTGPCTGTDNYGGPVVTANGLLFIGATSWDKKFRAYHKLTGKLLWEAQLPAAGNATPSLYVVNGRQYIVIACGGGKNGAPSGGAYVAFALPRD